MTEVKQDLHQYKQSPDCCGGNAHRVNVITVGGVSIGGILVCHYYKCAIVCKLADC